MCGLDNILRSVMKGGLSISLSFYVSLPFCFPYCLQTYFILIEFYKLKDILSAPFRQSNLHGVKYFFNITENIVQVIDTILQTITEINLVERSKLYYFIYIQESIAGTRVFSYLNKEDMYKAAYNANYDKNLNF